MIRGIFMPDNGSGRAVGVAVRPLAGRRNDQLFQTWNSASCPAGQPVFAVMFTRR